ncbi:MAG: branched-chain amino acid transport system ATP-binding protein [Actinomycetota bacterium]|jgi:branched-chain amino acid transport system ATP-binding protein|nr:branched-chain amino acid transport system ATP-binding protein [Actinomycetota bacterium]MDQ1667395.1 branched-chain amino acid transport system ATP-binding protein [Actinomycetota bacterium]
MLEVRDLEAAYGRGNAVVRKVSLALVPGEMACVMGHNGAGKTTLLRALFGLLRDRSGSVLVGGTEVSGLSPLERVRAGMAYSPSGRAVLPGLTVAENLDTAADVLSLSGQERARRRKLALDLFPILGDRQQQRAGSLSGGEQRMLSIGMVIMQQPRLMLLDEPSLGLSPLMVQNMYDAIAQLRGQSDVTVLVVEQTMELSVIGADSLYIMRMGALGKYDRPAATASMQDLWQLL